MKRCPNAKKRGFDTKPSSGSYAVKKATNKIVEILQNGKFGNSTVQINGGYEQIVTYDHDADTVMVMGGLHYL